MPESKYDRMRWGIAKTAGTASSKKKKNQKSKKKIIIIMEKNIALFFMEILRDYMTFT